MPSMMDFEEQNRRAQDLLVRKGVSRHIVEPPYGLLLRPFGVQARPLPFASFWRTAFLGAAWFAPVWGLAMWFWRWRDDGMGLLPAVLAAVLAGLFYGLSMACYMAHWRKKQGLPTWESLARPDADREA